eukprot:m.10988 g.10988  ORF g.10988 m.10988 type:complete len:605 (-) comp7208_c0_seq1:1645-3459(-)
MAHSITRGSLDSSIQDMEAALEGCSFIAIDFEMTGIGPWRQDQADTAQARYTSMKSTAEKYNVVQFGVAVFTEVSPGKFESRPYNFFTFPADEGSSDVTLSASAVHFLARNKMDFQTWLAEGSPYVTATRAEALRKKIMAPAPPKRGGNKIELTWDADKTFITEAFVGFDKWVEELGDDASGESEYVFPPCNAWLRRVVYQEIEERVEAQSLEGIETESRSVDGAQTVAAVFVDAEAKIARDLKIVAERQAKFDKAVGVTRAFNAVVAAKKPLIGHNLLFDLLFMLNSFDDALPTTYNAFAKRVEELFPVIFDTKMLASTGSLAPSRAPGSMKLDNTVLGNLYGSLSKDGKLDHVSLSDDELFAHYSVGGSYHEAGWDAHCTGAVFAALGAEYVVDVDGTTLGAKSLGPDSISPLVKAMANQLHGTGTVMRWSLRGDPSTQARLEEGATVYLSGLTEADKTDHIASVFTGGLVGEARHEIKWAGGSSAFVSVYPKKGEVIDQDYLIREMHAKLDAGKMMSATTVVHPWETFCAGVPTPLPTIEEAPTPHGTWGKVQHAWNQIASVFGSRSQEDPEAEVESGEKRSATTAAVDGESRGKRAKVAV